MKANDIDQNIYPRGKCVGGHNDIGLGMTRRSFLMHNAAAGIILSMVLTATPIHLSGSFSV
jgi:hypothetical protein